MDFQTHKVLVDVMEHLGVQFGDSLSQILIRKVWCPSPLRKKPAEAADPAAAAVNFPSSLFLTLELRGKRTPSAKKQNRRQRAKTTTTAADPAGTTTESSTLTRKKRKKKRTARKIEKDRRRRLDFIRRKREEEREAQADTSTTTQGLGGADAAATAAGLLAAAAATLPPGPTPPPNPKKRLRPASDNSPEQLRDPLEVQDREERTDTPRRLPSLEEEQSLAWAEEGLWQGETEEEGVAFPRGLHRQEDDETPSASGWEVGTGWQQQKSKRDRWQERRQAKTVESGQWTHEEEGFEQ